MGCHGDDEINLTKTCTECDISKILSEFQKSKKGKFGIRSKCKDCEREINKKYYEEHRKERLEYSKKYAQENRDKILKYREDNKEKKAIQNRKYCEENKEKIKKQRKKSYQKNKKKKVAYGKKYYRDVARQRRGHKPMNENKFCSSYLGVFVAERLCRHLFKDVVMMPYGNTGFDIVCNKGKKIDVKSSCTRLSPGRSPGWKFHIKENTTADFFILVAFDNLIDLNPLYIWMIPGKEINEQGSASIALSRIHKWNKWERDVNDAQLCCAEMKETNHGS